MSTFLTWLLNAILTWLAAQAAKAAAERAAQLAEDRRRGQTNETNLKAYEEATDRAERIAAATALLNGDPP